MHPTGYPLFVLLGKVFTLIPAGSVAWRMNLLSAMAAAAVVGMAVLILVRLGVRPVIAAAAGIALAFTGTLWQEATFSEMNSLHLLLVALLLHRALVWRADRRVRDLLIGAFLGGLCVSNHGLAITVVPIVVLFVVVDARREIAAAPWTLVRAGGAFVLGLVPYLYLPLRAMFGPADVYGQFLTWDGFFAHVSGAQFRGAMHFLSADSVADATGAMPQVVDHLVSLSNVVFLAAGVLGIAVLVLRDRWFGLLLVVLGAINVYFYANYMGDLSHYLLTTWLILALGLGYLAEMVVRAVVARVGSRAARRRLCAVRAAGRPVCVELRGQRPVRQHRRRAVRGHSVRGAATKRGPRHLLGCPGPAQLQAMRRGHPSGCDPAGLRPGGPRHLRRAGVAAHRGGEEPAGLRVDDVPRIPPRADGSHAGPGTHHQAAVGQALPGDRPGALPAGPRRRALRWPTAYELLDVGGGARLERFADRVTDRPHPAALGARGDPAAWIAADLRFDRDRGWTGAGRGAVALAGDDRRCHARAPADRRGPGRAVPRARRDAAVAARTGGATRGGG